MIIKWYNRDNISDVEMKQARLVAERLQGKKQSSPDGITLEQIQELYKDTVHPKPNQIVFRWKERNNLVSLSDTCNQENTKQA